MTTTPATSQETQEAIEALLMLGNPPDQTAPDPEDNEVLMPIALNQEPDKNLEPPELPTLNLPDSQDEAAAHEPGTVLGVAIKVNNTANVPDVVNQPQTTEEDDTKPDRKNGKKKIFVTKEELNPTGNLNAVSVLSNCSVCAVKLDTV